MKIAVVGNCQAFSYAYAMALSLPHAEVDRFTLLGATRVRLEPLAGALKSYDFVFSQNFGANTLRDNAQFADLVERLPNVYSLPNVHFSGFHPDIIYLFDPTDNDRLLEGGPLGGYTSALALYAYLRGWSAGQASALFTSAIFHRLGYFELWDAAAGELLREGDAHGINLDKEFLNWSRRGNFMHTPTHPKPFVFFDIVAKILKKAGIEPSNPPFDDFAVDDFARGFILPVHPPLADRFGLKGSDLYKLEHYKFSKGTGRFLTLSQMTERAFHYFAALRPAQIQHERIERWLADKPLAEAVANVI